MFSISQKSGYLISGEFSCEKSLKSKKSFLIVVANDSSNNTKKKFENKAFYYKVPIVCFSQKDKLSAAIGKINRSVFSFTNKGIAEKILNDILLIQNNNC